MSGSPFSQEEYNSIIILFFYEYTSDCPLAYEEYLDNIEYSSLTLIVLNEHFDPSDVENPIGTIINDHYSHYFSPKIFNRYSLNIQKNTYEIEGGGLFSQK